MPIRYKKALIRVAEVKYSFNVFIGDNQEVEQGTALVVSAR